MEDPFDPEIVGFVDVTDSFASEGDDIYSDAINIIDHKGDDILMAAFSVFTIALTCHAGMS